MDRICRGAERQRVTMVSGHRLDVQFEAVEEAIAMAAMYTANHFDVAAIVAMTESGATAKWMSRISSGIPIFAMSPHEGTVRRVSLYRGVYPIKFDSDMTSAEADQLAINEMRRLDVVKSDDTIVMTKGDVAGVTGGTNTMKVLKV
jgi:pyruvate kinase